MAYLLQWGQQHTTTTTMPPGNTSSRSVLPTDAWLGGVRHTVPVAERGQGVPSCAKYVRIFWFVISIQNTIYIQWVRRVNEYIKKIRDVRKKAVKSAYVCPAHIPKALYCPLSTRAWCTSLSQKSVACFGSARGAPQVGVTHRTTYTILP